MILKTPPLSPEKRGAAAEQSDSSSDGRSDGSSDGSNGGMDLDGLGAFGDAAEFEGNSACGWGWVVRGG